MKHYLLLYCVVLGMCLSACAENGATLYQIEFPSVPKAWRELLGEPCWKVVWISPQGYESFESNGNAPTLTLVEEWTSPIIAYPFWPERGLQPNMMKPAGALFPLDVKGARILLSWQGGVEALVYQELASAAARTNTASRLPLYFNWPRFRELLADDTLNEHVRNDPWLVDWQEVCLKTVQSHFDKRRIVPRKTEPLLVPLNIDTDWIASSPFVQPLTQAGESLILEVSSAIDTYVSAQGVLRCTKGAWIWQSWDKGSNASASSGSNKTLSGADFP